MDKGKCVGHRPGPSHRASSPIFMPYEYDFSDPTDHLPLNHRLEDMDRTPDRPSNGDAEFEDGGSRGEDIFPDSCRNDLVVDTPNGTRYWIPNVPRSETPVEGMVFPTWEDAMFFYNIYAEKAGFCSRIGQCKKLNGVITHRYLLCSRAGKPHGQLFDSTDSHVSGKKRTRTFKVLDCKASLRLKAVKDSRAFVVYGVIERHNHELVNEYYSDLKLSRRKLSVSDQQFIHNVSMSSVGPSVAYRLQCSMNGGARNVPGSKTDYKNFNRDVRMFIGNRDAQMFVDKMKERSSNLPNFTFHYTIADGVLKSVFWADGVSKASYESFGDVVAFDATYHTNKYDMIFVPFTGVDHHKKCVTFAAGLLASESVQSYEWLLECFISIFPKQPVLLLTGQDPSVKQAVQKVFTQTKHRLCMWHIMKKLPSKFSMRFLESSNFRKAVHKLVWNLFIPPHVFERRWASMIAEFNLTHHRWLIDMYNIRENWVPAYFRKDAMSCLMKTTSRCESSNAQFKVNSRSGNTLVQFILCFDTAMDCQRNNQRMLQFKSNTSSVFPVTDLSIERHASNIYTHQIFVEVQKEILKGKNSCCITDLVIEDGVKVFSVHQLNAEQQIVNHVKVRFNMEQKVCCCSCNLFMRIGYLCRHIFCVFWVSNVKEIPDDFILRRWTKGALPPSIYANQNLLSGDQSEAGCAMHRVHEDFSKCVDHLSGNVKGLQEFEEQLISLHNGIVRKFPSTQSKKEVIQGLIGCSDNVEPTFIADSNIKNKGSRLKKAALQKRVISEREKATENLKKRTRFTRTQLDLVNDS